MLPYGGKKDYSEHKSKEKEKKTQRRKWNLQDFSSQMGSRLSKSHLESFLSAPIQIQVAALPENQFWQQKQQITSKREKASYVRQPSWEGVTSFYPCALLMVCN